MERQIILALEGSAFVISLANAVYSYWHYAKNRKLRSNQETAVAQTLCLVSSVLAWLSKDWDHKVLKPGDEGKLVSAMLVFFTLGWALELLVVLRYTRAIRNCLLYRPIWNQIIKGITLLVFLVTVFCLIMGIIRTKPGVAGLDVYHRYVGMIWGGYTLFLSIGIAGVVAAMVFKTWRDMYTAASKNVAVGDTTTTRIKELDRIKKFVIVGNILVMAVVLAAGVFYATRPPEDELSESMSKISGSIMLSWLLYMIYIVRRVSSFSQDYASGRNTNSTAKAGTSGLSAGQGTSQLPAKDVPPNAV